LQLVDEYEYLELHAFLRRRIRASGLAGLDDELATEALDSVELDTSAEVAMLRYLDALLTQLRLEDIGGRQRVLATLNTIAPDQAITRLMLEVPRSPGELLDRRLIDLTEGPDLSRVIEQLEYLRRELGESAEG
jgi:hypothetical protein